MTNRTYPIFLSSWSIKDQLSSGRIRITQLPQFAQSHDFDGVEFVDRHFPGLSSDFRNQLISAVKESDIATSLGLTTDFTVNSKEYQEKQIDYVLLMIDFAQQLGASSVRILLGGDDFILQKWLKKLLRKKKEAFTLNTIKKQKLITSWLQRTPFFHVLHKLTIQSQRPMPLNNPEIKGNILHSLEKILTKAEQLKIPLAIENHWGVSAHTDTILDIISHFQSSFLGTCPDLGNFTIHQDRYIEIKKLLPFAKEIHAKTYRFNHQGEEKTIDYKKCIKLIKSSSFQGPLVVEYEGRGNKIDNSLQTRDLILKYL